MINSISAKIIMPKTAPQIKIENTKNYGAEVILYDTYFQSREEIGNEIQKKDNRALIKPYDDEDIIAGQGTAAIEIVNDLKEQSIEPDLYLCCCGGGGLIEGTSTYLKHIYPNIRSYSVEPDEFDDTKRSLEAGKIIENKKKNMFGIQFHPEVSHTNKGKIILRNFLFSICKLTRNWSASDQKKKLISEVREIVGNSKVICALSGGVDSSVVAKLLSNAIGKKLTCIFVNTGLLRKNEEIQIINTFKQKLKIKLIYINAKNLFIKKIK